MIIKHLFAAVFLANAAQTASAEDTIKLYAMDCGTIEASDMASFDSEGRFAGQPKTLVVPCYLIRHPKGDLLWDAGFNETMVDTPVAEAGGFHASMSVKLTDQLAGLGLAPADIEYISLSHWHPDHSGNAGLFASSTWIVHKDEHAFMFSDAMKEASGDYAALENAKTIQFTETHDLFGDGSVVMVPTPGHTAGHSILKLTLADAGTLLFSGDLFTHAEGRKVGAIPAFNVDKEQTIQSMALFEKLVKQHAARVIIEHEKADFDALPKFPDYLE